MSPFVLFSLALVAQVEPGPEAVFRSAIEDFEFGEHAQAAAKLRSVLEPIKLQAREDLIVARQYLGACYHLLNDRQAAKKEFALLLALDPDHQLDPEVFSPALVQFFEEVRAEAGLKNGQKTVLEAPPPPNRIIAPPPPPPPPLLTAPAPVDHSPAWSLIPFGVGQFANHHPVRGVLFAVGEVGLLSTALGTFLAFEGLKVEGPGGTTAFRPEDEDAARTYQTAYLVTFWGGVALMGLGVIEALLSYPGDVPAPATAMASGSGPVWSP